MKFRYYVSITYLQSIIIVSWILSILLVKIVLFRDSSICVFLLQVMKKVYSSKSGKRLSEKTPTSRSYVFVCVLKYCQYKLNVTKRANYNKEMSVLILLHLRIPKRVETKPRSLINSYMLCIQRTFCQSRYSKIKYTFVRQKFIDLM